MLTYLRTSIFESPAQTLVNTVNTVGVMGKGIAKEFKKRHPDMFHEDKRLCEKNRLQIGTLHLWRASSPWILNFPTKTTWKKPSQLEYIEAGLTKFRSTFEEMGVTSISFPPLGCGNGNLDWEDVRPLMEEYLARLPIRVYVHDKQVGQDFVPEHKEAFGAAAAPADFRQFIVDLDTIIDDACGNFKTLREETPFSVVRREDGSYQIRRPNGRVERIVTKEELETTWSLLHTGLLTADQYADGSSKRYKTYIFSMLSELPYVRVAEIRRNRQGTSSRGHGLFIRAHSDPNHGSPERKVGPTPESHQLALCLSH